MVLDVVKKLCAALRSCVCLRGYVAVVLLAAVFIGPYWLSIGGRRLQLSNDFDLLYFRYKAYLLDVAWSEHRMPLWSPAEGAGVPFYSNPFAAACYPLNLPLLLFRGAAGGYSVADHQCFASLAILILCAGLYAWIRSLEYPVLPAVFAATVAGTSLKITELMRFPNAIHAAAWMPWILCGVTWALQGRKRIRGLLVTGISTVMVLTAGYPYFIYYLQFLAGPYVILALAGRTRRALAAAASDEAGLSAWRGLFGLAIAFGGALAVCLPHLRHMRLFLDQMQDRGGGDFAYATAIEWSLMDTLGSFVYPPAAMAEGWFYFGMTGVLLVLVYLVQSLHRLHRTRRGCEELGMAPASPSKNPGRPLVCEVPGPPFSPPRRDLFFIGILAFWFIGITYLTMGEDSYLFRLMWHYWPGFSRLRVWPRLNVVLVPLIALALARACTSLRLFVTSSDSAEQSGGSASVWWLVMAYLPLAAVQVALWSTGYVSWYFQRYVLPGPFRYFGTWWFLLSGLLAFLALLVVLAARQRVLVRHPAAVALLLLAMVGLSFVDTGVLGFTQWACAAEPFEPPRAPVGVRRMWDLCLTTPRTFTPTTLSLSPAFNAGIIDNWYFDRYVRFLKRCGLEPQSVPLPQSAEAQAALRLLGCVDGQRLYFIRSVGHQTARQLLADADSTQEACRVGIHATSYDGDTLEVRVDTDAPGWLCFIDNWDPHWTAWVNGRASPVTCVLGTFKAVEVPPGRNSVRFEYRPFG